VAGASGRFDWDGANRAHLARHGVTPEEFEQGMKNDPVELVSAEVKGEPRTKVAAITDGGRILEMVYALRRGKIRAVTAYPAKKRARERYYGYFNKI
jgi:uncharacterized DUF497 family protein